MRDYPLVDPAEDPRSGLLGVAGVDWGYARDASTLVVLAVDIDATRQRTDGRPVLFLPWLVAEHRMEYERFVELVVAAAAGYQLTALASEQNGVGMAPTQLLNRALLRDQRCAVTRLEPVHTTSRLKEDAFGMVKLLLQQGRLLLPRHPELLKQLANLSFEMTDGGSVRIAVPDARGHDDLAMGLCLAVTLLTEAEAMPLPQELDWSDEDEGWQPVRIGPDL